MKNQKTQKSLKKKTLIEILDINNVIPVHLRPLMTGSIYDPLIFIGSPDFLKGFLSDFYRDKNTGDKK